MAWVRICPSACQSVSQFSLCWRQWWCRWQKWRRNCWSCLLLMENYSKHFHRPSHPQSFCYLWLWRWRFIDGKMSFYYNALWMENSVAIASDPPLPLQNNSNANNAWSVASYVLACLPFMQIRMVSSNAPPSAKPILQESSTENYNNMHIPFRRMEDIATKQLERCSASLM